MPTSIREQVLDALTSAVGGVYALETPDDERDLPVTALRDDQEAAEESYGVTNVTMPVAVARAEAATSQDRNAMRTQCDAIHAALIAEVSASSALKLLIDGVDYTGGFIQAVGDVCVAQANFNVRYHFVSGDPYTKDEE